MAELFVRINVFRSVKTPTGSKGKKMVELPVRIIVFR